jgi:hypothetical protein
MVKTTPPREIASVGLLRVKVREADEVSCDFSKPKSQYRRLVEAAERYDARSHVMVLFGGDAGLRMGEMIALCSYFGLAFAADACSSWTCATSNPRARSSISISGRWLSTLWEPSDLLTRR